MEQIIVYFLDNHKVVFDREKVVFRDGSGDFFALSDSYIEDDYASLLNDGAAVVNWENVCWVREYTPKDSDEDDL